MRAHFLPFRQLECEHQFRYSYPTRAEVEGANSSRLRKLPGPDVVFHSRDLPGRDEEGKPFHPERVERAFKDLVVPKRLPLKVGAQVMIVKNIIQGLLVNGSVGRIVGFYKPREALAMGIEIALPDSRERGGPDVPDIPGGPQVEVPQTTSSQAPKSSQKTAADKREETIKQILQMNSVWPAVQFQSGVTQLCVPLTFEVVSAEGTIEAIRHQVRTIDLHHPRTASTGLTAPKVPLILAWALSIHKSQGQTLERVRVDLGRIFEKGQCKHIYAYRTVLF